MAELLMVGAGDLITLDRNKTTSPHDTTCRHSATSSHTPVSHTFASDQTLQTFPSAKPCRQDLCDIARHISDLLPNHLQWQRICSDLQSTAPCASWIAPFSRRKSLPRLLVSSTTKLFRNAGLSFFAQTMFFVSNAIRLSDLIPMRLMRRLERSVFC